jgi:potassium/hydrogen antiporter
MLDETRIFGLLGGLLILAFFANRLSRWTRVPDILILMGVGLLVGPVAGWIAAAPFRVFTSYLGTFALILILFEAGTELNLRDALRHFPAGIVLAFLGYALSFAAAAVVAHGFLHLPAKSACLLGAVFGCTSSTMIIPVMQQLEIRGPVNVILILEAALGDVIAVLTVGSLIDVAEGDPLVAGLLSGIVFGTATSAALAIAAALIWWWISPGFAGSRFGNVLNIGVILTVYTLVRLVGGSGLLAVLAFGLTLANLPPRTPKAAPDLAIFHSDLSFLVRSFFFVLLGASVELIAAPYIVATALVLAGLFLARLLSVVANRWSLRSVSPPERQLILSFFPRGLVNAVLAVQVANSKGAALAFLPSMAFTIILVTNLLVIYGAVRFRAAVKSPS